MLAPPDPDSNIGANLQIYNAISDDYMQHTRQLPENALRIQDGAARILAHVGEQALLHPPGFWLRPWSGDRLAAGGESCSP